MTELISQIDGRFYQMMVEQTRDYAFFALDPNGHVTSWNAGAQLIKGYAASEILGRHFSAFYTHEAISSGWPDYELRMATIQGRFEDEGWRLRKDGSRFWAAVVITAVRDELGRLIGFSKITRDLSERRAHEEALRLSEERFRLLIESVVDYAIYMLDVDGYVTSWNTGAKRILGYEAAEAQGKHFSYFHAPEDIQADRPWLALSTARRDGRSEDEGWRIKKDGSRFWARATLNAIHDADGNLCGFAKIVQDLSERRHTQDLERAAKNINEFIATLAHEMRNPLAPIRAAMQVIYRLPAGDPALESMYRMIDRQSAHLVRMVDDMIDIVRISRGKLSFDPAPIDARDVVERSVEACRAQVDKAGHRLQVLVPPVAVTVYGDVNRLVQLVTNLLNNAARYTPAGGDITVALSAFAAHAELSVKDTGKGIEAPLLERIFGMFEQGAGHIEQAAGGLGIGLALARKIADLHGGALSCASAGTDQGAEFVLTLPLHAGIPALAAAPADDPA
ncbi:MAG: PAS domain-containing sensor histidine kinase [Rhodocyclaceae bacterium]